MTTCTPAGMLQECESTYSLSPRLPCPVQGQEVQSVSSQAKEAEGVTAVAEPPPAPDEAPSADEDAAEGRAPEKAAGGAPPPAEAWAAAMAFPLQDSIVIDLAVLPQASR